MQVEEVNVRHKCDSGHEFIGKDAKLVPFGSGFHAPMASFVFATKEHKLMRGSPGKDDLVLACPVCSEVHLSGFDKA